MMHCFEAFASKSRRNFWPEWPERAPLLPFLQERRWSRSKMPRALVAVSERVRVLIPILLCEVILATYSSSAVTHRNPLSLMGSGTSFLGR